jgi:nucleoside-diphosphate-sugar epimerase
MTKSQLKALVTGAAGFIGSHLVDTLLERQYNVVGFDNMTTGRISNLQHAMESKAFTLIKGDVRDLEELRAACREVDVVFHLAAATKVAESVRDPRLYHDVNVTGTLNVITSAVESEARRLVFASSAAVYGTPSQVPTPEGAPRTPLSPYGASKVAGELFCQTIAAHNPTESVLLRFFNVYGPRQLAEGEAGVVCSFIHRALTGGSMVIFGDGHQTRDFIFVDDVVEAMLRAATYQIRDSLPFNVGTGHPVSILELAREVQRQCPDSSSEIVFEKTRTGDIYHSVAAVGRMQHQLQFKAGYNISQGISKTLDQLRAS